MMRVLIANRGEIALRVLRACQELNIETVAAYTLVDRHAAYLKWADDTVCVGRQSYMDGTQFIAAAQTLGCDAIHPGYGFLSESASFAELVVSQNLKFIGPSSSHIALMGDKANARRVMQEAGVPVLPGSDTAIATLNEASTIAREIGYPVMLKASRGGGGRGIVIAQNETDLSASFENIAAEAESLFGSRDVYIEKYLAAARHIELQVFGDGQGQVIHMGLRECSIQRRHQKLLEEAPPAGIEDDAVTALAETACRALSELKYRSAGTLEFLYEGGKFYFIEMNTRIQVEHPVTEMISGIDLVKLQLRLESQGRLGVNQSEIRLRGHAIECRINAEDEAFNPAPGRVERLMVPGGPGIRFDSHLTVGYDVPHQYDSLLAKVISAGSDREESIMRMQRALSELDIRGPGTNTALHLAILNDPQFRSGTYDTNFIEKQGRN